MLPVEVKTQVQTAQTSITLSASLMVSISSVALFVAWGMMVAGAGQQIQEKVFHVAVNAPPPKIEKLWEYPFLDVIDISENPTFADFGSSPGLEVISDVKNPVECEIGVSLILSSMGEPIYPDFYRTEVTDLPILVDWNNDGTNEIVYRDIDMKMKTETFVVVNQGGTVLHSFLVGLPFFAGSMPAIVDLNHDGTKDIVIAFRNTVDRVKAINGNNGDILWQYEIKFSSPDWLHAGYSISSPIVPDMDRDGNNDILFISSECLTKDDLVNGKVVNDGGLLKIYGVENADFVVSNYNGVLKKNGENLCGTAVFRLDSIGSLVWRTFLNKMDNDYLLYSYQLASADFDADGILEIVAAPIDGVGGLAFLNNVGDMIWYQDDVGESFGVQGIGNLIRSDGPYDPPEIVTTYKDPTYPWNYHIGIFNSSGALVTDINKVRLQDTFSFYSLFNRSLSDLDGDGLLDIVLSDGVVDGIESFQVFKGDGSMFAFYRESGVIFGGGVHVADINGDGHLDIVVDGTLAMDRNYKKSVFLTFPQSSVEKYAMTWPMPRHDLHRTAWYDYKDPSAFPALYKEPALFRRGDANGDGVLDISDPIFILRSLMPGGIQPSCQDATDADDNGQIQTQDAIISLNYMFAGGPEISSPGPTIPGPDPTADNLGCMWYP